MSTMFTMFSDKQLNSAEVKIFLEFTPMAKMAGNLKNPHQDFTEISEYPMDLNGNPYFTCHVE